MTDCLPLALAAAFAALVAYLRGDRAGYARGFKEGIGARAELDRISGVIDSRDLF